jgi:hypothetical protein
MGKLQKTDGTHAATALWHPLGTGLVAAGARRYTARMTLHRFFLLALACAWAAAASAQYQWLDKDGRKVFSDRPPPMDVPQKNILKEPRALTPARASTAAPATAAAEPQAKGDASGAPPQTDGSTAAPAPQTGAGATGASGTDKSLEEAKTKAEEQEKAQKKAQEEAKAKKDAQARADNCQRARQAKITLEPGRLVATTNAQGERAYMDDATRTAELQRAEQIIQRDCK